MNKQIVATLMLAMVVGILATPVLAGTCGVGDDCQYCLTEETCIAQSNCVWNTDVCNFGGIVPLTAGNIASVLTYLPNLFSDLNVLIILIIGLPLAFWIISKVISLVRAR
jgi:hypothetical protein